MNLGCVFLFVPDPDDFEFAHDDLDPRLLGA